MLSDSESDLSAMTATPDAVIGRSAVRAPNARRRRRCKRVYPELQAMVRLGALRGFLSGLMTSEDLQDTPGLAAVLASNGHWVHTQAFDPAARGAVERYWV